VPNAVVHRERGDRPFRESPRGESAASRGVLRRSGFSGRASSRPEAAWPSPPVLGLLVEAAEAFGEGTGRQTGIGEPSGADDRAT